MCSQLMYKWPRRPHIRIKEVPSTVGRIAVIGGSGFIGSHLVGQLLDEGHEVVNFDVMSPSHPNVKHVYLDVTDLSQMTVAMAGNWDAIYLLAAVANVNHVYVNPVEAYTVNMMSVINTLEVARRNRVPRILYASTIWVYELASEDSVDEDTPLVVKQAKHLYTVTKTAGEMTVAGFGKLYGLSHTILRFGIPYGPGARMGTVMTEFVRRAFAGEPITIQGDGSQYRNFIHVSDLARGCVAALSPRAVNQTYNLEGSQRVTIKEIADVIRDVFPSVQVEYTEARPGDFRGKNVSWEKAAKELGWKPEIPFREGLIDYIDWYKRTVVRS